MRINIPLLASLAGAASSPRAVQATLDNLALGKIASSNVDALAYQHRLSTAFDGDYISRWVSASGYKDVYLQVDLGQSYYLDKVRIAWEYHCAKNYDIEVSHDGSTFNKVWSTTNRNCPAGEQLGWVDSDLGDLDSSPYARYVRMHANEIGRIAYLYSIWEMEVYGSLTTDGPTTSPTTVGPTTSPTTVGPTTSPTTVGPTTSPTTVGPTTSPTTVGPTTSPTTNGPTTSPTTNGPTTSPKTDGPTTSPTTSGPTTSPTTSGPTTSPTTSGPTTSPTTSGPTTSPTTSGPIAGSTDSPTPATTPAPTSTPWTIGFLDIISNFSESSGDEVIMKYVIGKNRTFETLLYERDCVSNITGIMVNSTKAKTNINMTHDLLTLSYSIDKSAIANSTIWNSTDNKIEICQIVNLIVPASHGRQKMTVVEDIRQVDIDFDLSADFTVENELGAGTIEAAAGETNVSSYVKACKCKSADNFTCTLDALVPNTQLYVCIKSVSSDVKVKQLKSMVIKQGSAELSVVDDSEVKISSITEMTYVESENGVVVATFVPTNIFNYTTGASINITGGIDMELVNSSRRLLTDTPDGDVLNANRNGQEFKLQVDLEEQVIVLEGEGAWMDSSGTFLNKASALLGMTLLVAYGFW